MPAKVWTRRELLEMDIADTLTKFGLRPETLRILQCNGIHTIRDLDAWHSIDELVQLEQMTETHAIITRQALLHFVTAAEDGRLTQLSNAIYQDLYGDNPVPPVVFPPKKGARHADATV